MGQVLSYVLPVSAAAMPVPGVAWPACPSAIFFIPCRNLSPNPLPSPSNATELLLRPLLHWPNSPVSLPLIPVRSL